MDRSFEERQWLRGLHAGDPRAFTYIYNLHTRHLLYFVRCIVTDRLTAEDIASESLIKTLNRARDFDSLAAVKSFLFTVARNAALDHLREKKNRQGSLRQLSYLSPEIEKDVERKYILSELVQEIHLEIEKLPLKCREVIRLSLLEGRSNQDIARQMGIAYKSVQNTKPGGFTCFVKPWPGRILHYLR